MNLIEIINSTKATALNPMTAEPEKMSKNIPPKKALAMLNWFRGFSINAMEITLNKIKLGIAPKTVK